MITVDIILSLISSFLYLIKCQKKYLLRIIMFLVSLFIYFSCKVTERNYKILTNIHVTLLRALEYNLSYLSATCGNC